MKQTNTRCVQWNTEKIASAFKRFVESKERLPVAREMNIQNGLPVCKTFERIMGMTLGQYARLHYPDLVTLGEARHKQRVLEIRREQSEWSEEKLIDAVMRFAERHDRLPSVSEYTSENQLPTYTTFGKIAQRFLTSFLEQSLSEAMEQSPAQKTDSIDEPEDFSEEESGMAMSL